MDYKLSILVEREKLILFTIRKASTMSVIVYDADCAAVHDIAMKIQRGVEQTNITCQLMSLDTISDQILEGAHCIIFGCKTGITPGVSYKMARFMERTRDKFENQIWKNKLSAGFTTNAGAGATCTIEDLCNFAARHSMIWISQGHLAENEGRQAFYGSSTTRVNSNKSYLGCIATPEQSDLTAEIFGKRIGQRMNELLNHNRR